MHEKNCKLDKNELENIESLKNFFYSKAKLLSEGLNYEEHGSFMWTKILAIWLDLIRIWVWLESVNFIALLSFWNNSMEIM